MTGPSKSPNPTKPGNKESGPDKSGRGDQPRPGGPGGGKGGRGDQPRSPKGGEKGGRPDSGRKGAAGRGPRVSRSFPKPATLLDGPYKNKRGEVGPDSSRFDPIRMATTNSGRGPTLASPRLRCIERALIAH